MNRGSRHTVLTIFGTRPEIIKFAPVISELDRARDFEPFNLCTSQHTDLAAPFLRHFRIRVDHDLDAMRPGQSLNALAGRILSNIDAVFDHAQPGFVLVQGDTTSALAGALAGFHRKIPVGHIEAGLRSGDPASPFPEEMNRRLISQSATLHFAATERNRRALLEEGIDPRRIHLTGNPVVDAIQDVIARDFDSPALRDILEQTEGWRRIILTAHRRENFEGKMSGYFDVLRQFVDTHPDVCLIFPVHPNPNVRRIAGEKFEGSQRIHLVDPLPYPDFIRLLSLSWIIVSDSGGVQEEAPSLGKRVLVIRENTERPESVECGAARLVGARPELLAEALDEADATSWPEGDITNPFGDGSSGPKIVQCLRDHLRSHAERGTPEG